MTPERARPVALPTLAARVEPVLQARLAQLLLDVEQGHDASWAPLIDALLALDAISRLTAPERRGRMLTVTEMAERLGVRAKSARRMVAEGRLVPAVHSGNVLRFRGDERPRGPAAPRPAAGSTNRERGRPARRGNLVASDADK